MDDDDGSEPTGPKGSAEAGTKPSNEDLIFEYSQRVHFTGVHGRMHEYSNDTFSLKSHGNK